MNFFKMRATPGETNSGFSFLKVKTGLYNLVAGEYWIQFMSKKQRK